MLAFSVNFMGMDLLAMLKLLVTLYSSVLFIQSGLDKVFDWKGNLSYITGKFEPTILRPFVPVLLPVITLLELGAGFCSLAGFVMLAATGQETMAVIGLLLAAKAILLLFFGLRVSKDYGAAAAITPYFIFIIFALLLFIR